MNNSDYSVELNKRVSKRIEKILNKLPQPDNMSDILERRFDVCACQSVLVMIQMEAEGWVNPYKGNK